MLGKEGILTLDPSSGRQYRNETVGRSGLTLVFVISISRKHKGGSLPGPHEEPGRWPSSPSVLAAGWRLVLHLGCSELPGWGGSSWGRARKHVKREIDYMWIIRRVT